MSAYDAFTVHELKEQLAALSCGDADCLIPRFGLARTTTVSSCRCLGAYNTIWSQGQRHRLATALEILAELLTRATSF